MMPKWLKILSFFLLVTGWPFAARATHIVGGEMTYTCLGNNVYEIKLTIFRDCFNGMPWFDQPASIGVFFGETDLLFKEIKVPLDFMLNDTLDPDLGSECFVAPPNVCVHTTTYTTIDTLPYVPGGYHLAYQRCCRNHTISNILQPDDVGATYSIVVGEQALLQCNSSPVFNDWPPLYLCVNKPFQVDQSAQDPDGDSLVYRLCDPLRGADPINNQPQPPNPPPYDIVPWIGPYNANNQIGGMPVMMIDPVTGMLTGFPNIIGQFVIGICVEEYRNGALIGTKRRDYQVNIGECAEATASFFTPDILCQGLTVTLNNDSENAENFLWLFNDPNNPGASSTLPEPLYTYADTGLFTIMLIAEPGTVCADTSTAQVQLYPNSLFANFNIVNGNCEENSLQIQIQDASVDTLSNIINWQWVITQGTTTYESNDTNPSFTLFTPGSASLSLIVTAANGCRDTLVQPFPVIFFNDEIFEDSAIYCIGNGNVPLNPDLDFAGASFQWLPPTGLSNPNSINPLANPGMTTTYQAVISDATGFCQTERTVTVLVSPDASVTPSIDTVVLGESVQILASFDPSYTYAWSPPTWLNDPSIHNPVSTPNNDISYLLTVTDEFGCFVELDVVLLVTTLCEEPFVFIPTGFSPNGDNKNDQFKVYGNDLELVRLVVYNRWGEKVFESTDPDVGWDGYYKGKLLPPDVYGFYAEVTCGNGGLFFKKGNVTLLR